MPIINKTEINYVYSDMNRFVEEIEENSYLPTLYVLDKNNNRFMDDLYLFTKIDKLYVLDSQLFSKEKIEEIFEKIDTENGVRIIISEGLQQKEQLDTIMEVINKKELIKLKRMNACNVYVIK